MKLRIPTPDKLKGLSLDETSIISPTQHHKEYQIKLITPIYGGGVKAGEPDEDMPIRATAIRGQLRFWWRLLQSHGPEKLTGAALFEKERAIWGGMGELAAVGEEPNDFSGKLTLRIRDVKNCRIKPCCEYTINQKTRRHRLAFLHDIPQYVMFLGQGKSPDAKDYDSQKDQPHPVILPGLTFCLEVSAPKQKLSDEEWESVSAAIKWWASFGGVGARTRRGLGAVDVDGLECITKGEVLDLGGRLNQIGRSPDSIKAWNKSIVKLQEFRQGEGNGRNKASDPNIPNKLGRSFWPEPDSIRQITGRHSVKGSVKVNGRSITTNDHSPVHKAMVSFPRAAFGLPIIFDFNANPAVGEPPKTELSPVNSERMASPLILKPMALGEQKYASIALILPIKHLDSLSLELKEGSITLSTMNANEWWSSSKAADVLPISKNSGTDALSAFLKYFGGE